MYRNQSHHNRFLKPFASFGLFFATVLMIMEAERIIIIDDELDILQLLKFLLRKFNCQVFCFQTLKEGLKMIPEIKPRLIFLDINLPDGNGLDVITLIKRNNPKTQLIMMSAYDEKKEKSIAFKNGADDYISKPFNSLLITSKLRGMESQTPYQA